MRAPFAAGQRYFQAVARGGGVPLMLPPIPALVDEVPSLLRRVDGIALHGGGDIDPRHYGQEATAEQLYGIVPEHDAVELAVVRAALDADLPMLAICRGMQVLNVVMGGTLEQHIGTEAHWFAHHEVPLTPGSKLAEAIGSTTVHAGHCVHHQALDRVADGMEVVGRTADGLIHAAEVPAARWTVATQWHPEDSADSDDQQQALFSALVAHC
ncbi:MAG: gamma-glutamyl-gamma-aminobutyrate hydrolase family protein [Ilumatobacteraceae bacterium]